MAVDAHLDRHAGAVLVRAQRAQVVRQRLRQHRDDAVGEIDRVAALAGCPVERVAGPHVPGDIGDRHQQPVAAGIGRVVVGRGPDRIVEIAGVLAVDGDEVDVAQVGAALDRPPAAPWRPAPAPRAERPSAVRPATATIRLSAFGSSGRPSRSTTRARGSASRRPGMHRAAHQIAGTGAAAVARRYACTRSRPCGRPARSRSPSAAGSSDAHHLARLVAAAA